MGLMGEDVFDPRPSPAFLPVPAFLAGSEGFGFRALDAQPGFELFGAQHPKALPAAVGAVRPDGLVAFIEQFLEALAVVQARLAGAVAADELGSRVALDVVLVAVMGLVVLLRPARVGVLLAELGGLFLPLFGHRAFPDGMVFPAAVALAGHLDEAGVHDDAFLSDQSELGEISVEPLENADDTFGSELVLEVPNGVLVGNLIAGAQGEETHEAEAVEDLELGLLLGQGEVFLEDDDAEHEDRVEGGVAAFVLAVVVAEDVEELVAEHLEVDGGAELVERAGFGGGEPVGVLDLADEILLSSSGFPEAHTRILVVHRWMASGELPDVPFRAI